MLGVEELSRRFGETVALDGLSFTVPTGAIWGFVGRNGAGKTTAMRIILGLLAPDSGQVRWHDQPVDAEVRRAAGYMPEERGLYPKMRVADQLRYLAQLRGVDRPSAERATGALLERLGIGERAADRVEELSLGNQQRVQLAAALVHDPSLLVLDEPFSGLDPVAVDVLSDTLAERAHAGATILFSSHQLELVERFCDGVTIIDRGSLVAGGRIGELREGGSARRVRVEVDTDQNWWHDTPGARVVEREGRAVVVEMANGASDQAILDVARAAGDVVTFTRVRATVAEIFREAVEASRDENGER